MSDIFYAQVLGMNKQKTMYYVRRAINGMAAEGANRELAIPLSPVPTANGGGMMSAPTNYTNLFAVCMKEGQKVFLIGFTTLGAGATGNTPMKSPRVENGGTGITHSSGSGMRVHGDGSVSMFADQWSQWILEPTSQNGFAQFRHMTIKWWTGWLSFLGLEDTGKLSLYLSKKINKAVLPTSLDAPPDDIKYEIGSLDTDGIVKWAIRCNANQTKQYDFTMNGELANLTEKKAIHYEQKQALAGIKATLDVDVNGSLKYTVAGPKVSTTFGLRSESSGGSGSGQAHVLVEGSENTAEVIVDVERENIVEVKINKDKCVISIDKEGNIIFKQAPNAKMYLGGKEAGQLLVTEAWVKQIFANHMHPTAAPGPPSPPIPIPPIPAMAAAKTNFFTFKIFGE
jgi:hypothetical protein